MPSVPWKVEFSKIFQIFFSKFQKCPKSFPNVSKRVLNVFWGQIFEKNFMSRVPRRVESQKNFKKIKKISKNPKMPKIVPKRIQTCFDCNLGQFSRKIFAQFSMQGRVLEIFQKKIKKFSKFQKRPKSFPKVSKRVLNKFWGKLFEKFLPSFPWKVESSKIFKKIKKFSKFQKCPKSFPKVSKRVLNMFWGKFFEKFLPSFPWNVESSKIFKKKKFKIPKTPKIVPKRIQT